MIKGEISLCTLDEFSLGLMTYCGSDEHGEFNGFTIGFLFFEINFYKYFN